MQSLLNGGVNIFNEIKKFRGNSKTVSSSLDGEVGSQKWVDWLILILDEDKLSSDELQFGFQPNCSTTVCSWAVSSVIDYYNQAGRPVYACAMDLSKAFDLVSWDKLFPELMERKISVLSLRCLIHIYKNQTCNVKWTDSLSHGFQVTNVLSG